MKYTKHDDKNILFQTFFVGNTYLKHNG